MKKIVLILSAALIAVLLGGCGKSESDSEKGAKSAAQTELLASEGYKLMQQKCAICHLEKPDPEKMSTMIAPPLARIQEHYKPSHKDKKDFIEAITAWVTHPNEEKTLMPGAVKKFNLMPHLSYPEAEVRQIAEVLYDIDFGEMPARGMRMGMGMMQKPVLNNGQKWPVKKETAASIDEINKKLETFSSDNLDDYHRLGTEIFNLIKEIIMDKTYSKDVSDQLHAFFHGVEGNLHFLISSANVEQAKKRQEALKQTFKTFYDYFESK